MTQQKALTMTIEEAARALGVGRQLVYALARQGRLPGAVRIGARRFVVSKVALLRFLETTSPADAVPGGKAGAAQGGKAAAS